MKKAFHKRLPGHSVEEQRAFTISLVPDEADSWTHGEGAETIHTLINAFKVRKGEHVLYLGMDLRVLGESSDDIRAALKALKAASVTVVDLANAEHDVIDMLARAQKAMRWNGDVRQQKRKGAKGGLARGAAAQVKRDAIMARDVVVRMCAHPKLTWKDCAEILGPPFTLSTLQRNYRF